MAEHCLRLAAQLVQTKEDPAGAYWSTGATGQQDNQTAGAAELLALMALPELLALLAQRVLLAQLAQLAQRVATGAAGQAQSHHEGDLLRIRYGSCGNPSRDGQKQSRRADSTPNVREFGNGQQVAQLVDKRYRV